MNKVVKKFLDKDDLKFLLSCDNPIYINSETIKLYYKLLRENVSRIKRKCDESQIEILEMFLVRLVCIGIKDFSFVGLLEDKGKIAISFYFGKISDSIIYNIEIESKSYGFMDDIVLSVDGIPNTIRDFYESPYMEDIINGIFETRKELIYPTNKA